MLCPVNKVFIKSKKKKKSQLEKEGRRRWRLHSLTAVSQGKEHYSRQ